jgi:hypothetical protein
MADITIVNGVYKPTYNWGHHPVNHWICFFSQTKIQSKVKTMFKVAQSLFHLLQDTQP